jgi:MoaA/NifB/PqqE/SkfB family radical SAM enzyme
MCLTHSRKFSNPWGQKPGKDMDFELFKQVLIRYKNALIVNLIGNGEPLFNKDLFRMIEFASSMKMYVFSGSNGILVGDYVEEILNSPLHTFIISINGHTRAEFSRMTGMPEELFDGVCRNTVELVNLRNSKRTKLRILVSIILDEGNYENIRDMIYFVESLGVDGVLFFQFLPSPAAGFTPEERCLFSDGSAVVKALAEAKSVRLNRKSEVVLPLLLSRSTNNKSCTVPFYNLAVDGEGNVGGCSCQLLNFSENGNFYDENNPWNNRYFRQFRRIFIEPELPLFWPCRWCYNNSGSSRLVSNPNPLSYMMRQVFHRLRK